MSDPQGIIDTDSDDHVLIREMCVRLEYIIKAFDRLEAVLVRKVDELEKMKADKTEIVALWTEVNKKADAKTIDDNFKDIYKRLEKVESDKSTFLAVVKGYRDTIFYAAGIVGTILVALSALLIDHIFKMGPK